jgi:hypothetical protein
MARGSRSRMTLHSIIANRDFQVFGVPVIFMSIGIFAKRLGRRDGDSSPQRNDCAVATTVLLMTLGVVVADLRAPTAVASDLVVWLVGILFVTFISIDHAHGNRSPGRAATRSASLSESCSRIWLRSSSSQAINTRRSHDHSRRRN